MKSHLLARGNSLRRRSAHVLIFYVFITAPLLLCQEIELLDRIIIREDSPESIISMWADLAADDDGFFIITDPKQVNFKRYDANGRFAGKWGRKGQGPGEFQVLNYCAFKGPYFAVLDTVSRKVSLYKKGDHDQFEYINRMPFAEMGAGGAFGSKTAFLNNSTLLVDAAADIDGKRYAVYAMNIHTGYMNGIIELPYRYGVTTTNEVSRVLKRMTSTSNLNASFLAVSEEQIFYAWAKMARIVSLNIKTKEINAWEANSGTLRLSRPIGEIEYLKMNEETSLKAFRAVSHIVGLFATNRVLGLIFVNYNEKIGLWNPKIQFFNQNGLFLKEVEIKDAVGEKLPEYSFDAANKMLYLLNDVPADNEDGLYRIIYKFRVLN